MERTRMSMGRWTDGLILGCALLIGWAGIEAEKPPRALGTDAPIDAFSAARAIKDVEAIARAPHPMGSEEAIRVREYLVSRLKELGLEPQIQSSLEREGPVNVLARLTGTGPKGRKAILLSAHYDSVAAGPGAGDNASGVAVILETLRALQSRPPLERDVIVLFDDGEEIGFDGSIIFVTEHPWAQDVGLVLNFDARGCSGPSFMFETSDGNGWLIKEYARAVTHPLATSLSMDVYRAMPNDTDLTVYKRAGLPGLNFAFGAGVAVYHTPDDTPAALSHDTLQHHGQNALEAVRWFGALDLDRAPSRDVVYLSLFSRTVVAYPIAWARPLAVAAVILYALVVRLMKARGLRLLDIAAGAGVLLFAMLVAPFLVMLVFMGGLGYNIVLAALDKPGIPWNKYDLPIMTACACLAAATTLVLMRSATDRRPGTTRSAGALFWWLAMAVATAIAAPGSSYLFVWPTVFGLLGVTATLLLPPRSIAARFANFGCALPALILFPPLIRTTFDSLGLDMAVPTVVVVVLFTGAMLPLFSMPEHCAEPVALEVDSARAAALAS